MFDAVERRGGHSTYRVYAKSDRSDPELVNVLETLKKMNCDLEPATDKIVNVHVLRGAECYREGPAPAVACGSAASGGRPRRRDEIKQIRTAHHRSS